MLFGKELDCKILFQVLIFSSSSYIHELLLFVTFLLLCNIMVIFGTESVSNSLVGIYIVASLANAMAISLLGIEFVHAIYQGPKKYFQEIWNIADWAAYTGSVYFATSLLVKTTWNDVERQVRKKIFL